MQIRFALGTGHPSLWLSDVTLEEAATLIGYWRAIISPSDTSITLRILPAPLTLTPDGGYMLTLKDTEQVSLTLDPRDARGNPAPVENARWTVSDPTILALTANGLQATVLAVGPTGSARVTVTVDAKIGAEQKDLVGMLDVDVVAGEAVSVGIAAGTPVEQTPATT
jgi:hypothetical protein